MRVFCCCAATEPLPVSILSTGRQPISGQRPHTGSLEHTVITWLGVRARVRVRVS